MSECQRSMGEFLRPMGESHHSMSESYFEAEIHQAYRGYMGVAITE